MKQTLILLLTILFFSCQSTMNKQNTNPIIKDLLSIQSEGILFGHQDDLAYGMKWKYVDGESDVKRVSGDYPAVFGWELGGLERGDKVNLDSVPFDRMITFVKDVHQMGGINTFSWHPYSLVDGNNSWITEKEVVKHIIPGGELHAQFKQQLDLLFNFFNQFKDKEGDAIPFIFRPWHEMGGKWFWWGPTHTTVEEYQQLFQFTIQYLKEKGLDNMAICYSPNGGYENKDKYLTWYPGDEYVDMLGVDVYDWNSSPKWVASTQNNLRIMIEVAKEKNMPAVLAETGHENLKNPEWFTQKLAKVLEPEDISANISYVLVWRNDPKVHHFFSYDGHASEKDAKEFLMNPKIWLLNDFKEKK